MGADVSLTSSTSAKFEIFGGSTALALLAAQLVLIPLMAVELLEAFLDVVRDKHILRRWCCDPLRLLVGTRNMTRMSAELVKQDELILLQQLCRIVQ